MASIEYVRDVLLTCPYIQMNSFVDPDPDLEVSVDLIDFASNSYSIESTPSNPMAKRYLSGESQQRFTFLLITRRPIFTDIDRINHHNTFQNVNRWMREQTRFHRLPSMGHEFRPLKLELIGNSYIHRIDSSLDTALYIMQGVFLYLEKVRY